MLRYFYILVCIQLCFSIDYTDTDIDSLERRVRSKSRYHKKVTRNPKRSRMVEFDVDNFMRQSADETNVNDYEPYSYRINKQNERLAPETYSYYGKEAPLIELTENAKPKKLDSSNLDENTADKNPRTAIKEAQGSHFNFNTFSFDNKNTEKAVQSQGKAVSDDKNLQEHEDLVNPESKCAYKGMRFPFFSYNKASSKTKSYKKRGMFCFNCHKKFTNSNRLELNSDTNTDKDSSSNEKIEMRHKLNRRAYEELCPKCIKELLNSLKGKTKKVKGGPTTSLKEVKTTISTKGTKPVADKSEKLVTNFQSDYNYLNYLRKKRDDIEENERERRLKELEEVERKIENVHITAPTFTRVSMSIKN